MAPLPRPEDGHRVRVDRESESENDESKGEDGAESDQEHGNKPRDHAR